MQKSKVKIKSKNSKVIEKKYPKPPSMKWVYLSLIIAAIGAVIAFLALYLVYDLAVIGNQLAGRTQ